jgi:hypothetical protein
MTLANGISIDLSTYGTFRGIIMMIKLTGVVCLENLEQGKGEGSCAYVYITEVDASRLTYVLVTFESRTG